MELCTVASGWVRIVGFGSLLAESSARRSFPTLRDFRLVRIPGARRVCAHPAPVFFERGIAKVGPPYEFSSLCAEPWSQEHDPSVETRASKQADFILSPEQVDNAFRTGRYMCAVTFSIPPEAMKEFRRREPEFAYCAIQPYAMDKPEPDGCHALVCARGSDEMLRERLSNDPAKWDEFIGRFGVDTVWGQPKEKIFPCQPYLRLCILAAESLGVKDNFLKSTFLADRATTILEYVNARPDVVTTPPPEHVRKYYTL